MMWYVILYILCNYNILYMQLCIFSKMSLGLDVTWRSFDHFVCSALALFALFMKDAE